MAGIEARFENFKLTVLPGRINTLTNTPESPVGIRIRSLADQLVQLASQKIGRRRYSGHHPENGSLADSGRVESTGGSGWRVVFAHPAAAVHHNGSVGHPIGAPGKVLSNPNNPARTEGGPFFARNEVFHRGAVANPFFVNAANELGLRASGALKSGAAGPFPIVRVR